MANLRVYKFPVNPLGVTYAAVPPRTQFIAAGFDGDGDPAAWAIVPVDEPIPHDKADRWQLHAFATGEPIPDDGDGFYFLNTVLDERVLPRLVYHIFARAPDNMRAARREQEAARDRMIAELKELSDNSESRAPLDV